MICIRGSAYSPVVVIWFILTVIEATCLDFPSSHANVTSDANTAALLGKLNAESSALSKTRELLGREDGEWNSLHFQAMRDVCSLHRFWVFWGFRVHILLVLELLIEREVETILSFVSD
jgi:hypothetical protein